MTSKVVFMLNVDVENDEPGIPPRKPCGRRTTVGSESTFPVNNMTNNKSSKTKTFIFLSVGVVLCLVAAWFTMSLLDYSSTGGFPFRTGGWFILGMFMIGPISIGYASLFLLISRRTGKAIAYSAMGVISAVLIALAVHSALPSTRLEPVIGKEALNVATIERLRTMDSFNEGIYFAGVLTGPPELMDLIVAHRSLEQSTYHSASQNIPLGTFRNQLPDIEIPDIVEVFSDERASFLPGPDKKYVYFVYRTNLTDEQLREQDRD
jgi:hypothetical protein